MTNTDEQQSIIMYGSPTCPMVPPVIGMLKRTGATYTYIDITQDRDADAEVRRINAGNASVPTLVFPDGSTLTEPSSGALRSKLQGMGYNVPFTAWLIGNAFYILIGIIFLIALLDFLEVI